MLKSVTTTAKEGGPSLRRYSAPKLNLENQTNHVEPDSTTKDSPTKLNDETGSEGTTGNKSESKSDDGPQQPDSTTNEQETTISSTTGTLITLMTNIMTHIIIRKNTTRRETGSESGKRK